MADAEADEAFEAEIAADADAAAAEAAAAELQDDEIWLNLEAAF